MERFPETRLRRLRQTPALRKALSIQLPGPEKFIWPVFVIEGYDKTEPINALPGQNRMSIDNLCKALEPIAASGIGGIMIFGVLDSSRKDAEGSYAWRDDGIVQQAAVAVRREFPDLLLFTDVCLCGYTDHGHCGPLTGDGAVDNDSANATLAKIALSHAAAGAQGVAPSAMMDGQVLAIRSALDEAAMKDTLIMSYSTKFASAMYGPFRAAGQSAPGKGDRKSYQAPPGDIHQALRESRMDIDEGADILMVKPALFYLDILSRLRQETDLPIAAYNVSGEYSMLHALAAAGGGDLKAMVRESMTALVRAGTDIILSYWANQYDELLKDD